MTETTADTHTPTEELRAAATKLREKAAPLLGGDKEREWADFFTLHGADLGLIREDEDWIAVMGPRLAEPFAKWLDLSAASCEVEATNLPGTTHALAVARLINGTES
jgi:hypothetical protein